MSNDDSKDVKQEAGQPSVSNRLLADLPEAVEISKITAYKGVCTCVNDANGNQVALVAGSGEVLKSIWKKLAPTVPFNPAITQHVVVLSAGTPLFSAND